MPMPIIGESSLYKVVSSLRELWQMTQNVPAAVGALQNTAWERIGRVVVSSSTGQINFALTQVYRSFRITGAGLRFVTAGVAAVVQVQLSVNGGSSFLTTADIYDFTQGAGVGSGLNGGAFLCETGGTVAASRDYHGVVDIAGAEQSGDIHFRAERAFENTAGIYQRRTAQGRFTGAGAAVNYIRLSCTGSNIDLGIIIVEGLRSP